MTNEEAGLSQETIAIVKSTVPILREHGLAITSRMYDRLFDEYPEVEAMFANTTPGQKQRLANAVMAYAANVDHLEAVMPVVESIADKHVAAGVTRDLYPIVGELLLGSMVDVLGPLDESVIDAWGEAYTFLANAFIEIEVTKMAAA